SAGGLLFHGRSDRQIKTRGFRVELESVEQVLNAVLEVVEAVVYPVKNGDEGLQIHAQAVLQKGSQISTVDLIKIMAKDLPPHALPADIKVVDQLPRTAAGKLDRNSIIESHALALNS
ncbi:MAG: hypothetical protein AAFO91_02545, partial [Bacteroidota bacterium]